jgi:predicted alpha/beta hydrolase
MSDMIGTTQPITHRGIYIAADDGYKLAATVFTPIAQSSNAPVTIIAGATGVPQSFYARFATFLAQHGRVAITFDYRGIGGSLHGPIRQSKARFREWGILDIPGVLAWAATTYPGHPIHWVGHSYGGFGTGLAHNNHLIDRQVGVSTMSADYRFVVNKLETVRIGAMLFAAGPMVAHTLGYVPGWINGGADLPKHVMLEWSAWCRTRGFLFGREDLPEQRFYARFKAPLMFAYMEDDGWIARAGIEHLAARYSGATERSFWHVSVAEGGGQPIGHIGFFRSQFRSTLWPKALAWLDGHSI